MKRTTVSFLHKDEKTGLVDVLSTTSFQRAFFQLSAFPVLEEENQVPVPKEPGHVSASKLFMAHSIVYLETQRCRLWLQAWHCGSPFPRVEGLAASSFKKNRNANSTSMRPRIYQTTCVPRYKGLVVAELYDESIYFYLHL